MFADLLPPPTFCMDWYMVGWPASLIVPCALSASLVAIFLLSRRPGSTRRNVLIMVVCIGVFIAADVGVYLFGVNFGKARGGWGERPEFFQKETGETGGKD
jgi:CDP-diglyceride synthetase